jgi:phosphoglycerol transferase MdoB-like AlkP superfamily enzyme
MARRRPCAFLAAALLAMILVAAKLAIAWPRATPHHVSADLLAICADDMTLALAFGLMAGLMLWLTSRTQRLHRWTWRGIVLAGALLALYAIGNIGVYRHLRQPLSARLIALMARPADMRSSIAAHSDRGTVLALMLIPIAYAVVLLLRRSGDAPPRARVKLALLLVALTWIACGKALEARTPADGWQRTAAKNAHCELAVSLFRWHVLHDYRAENKLADEPYPAAYLDDFRIAAERPPPPPLPEFQSKFRNLIFIVLESTTAQYLSLYGSKYLTTPNLDSESSHALIFERFYAHIGYTFCSMVPLTCGVHPGLPWCYRPNGPRPSPPGLAALLKQQHGMRTAYFAAAYPSWDGIDETVRRAGFDEVFGPDEFGGPMASSWGTEDGVVIDGLLRWLGKSPGRPFFAMVWTDQTHDPYTLARDTQPIQFLADNAFDKAKDLNRYLNAIRQVDRHLGRVFAWLRGQGLADDTLVVITGDHGEAFGELHADDIGHGSAMFDENLRVPLMLWNPRLFPTPRREPRIGGHVDVLPTLAHLFAVAPLPPDWQGTSLFCADHPGRVYLQADRITRQFGLTDGRYKYINCIEGQSYERLFDLQADPSERHDLSTSDPVRAAEFRARTAAFLKAEEDYVNMTDRVRAATAAVSPK